MLRTGHNTHQQSFEHSSPFVSPTCRAHLRHLSVLWSNFMNTKKGIRQNSDLIIYKGRHRCYKIGGIAQYWALTVGPDQIKEGESRGRNRQWALWIHHSISWQWMLGSQREGTVWGRLGQWQSGRFFEAQKVSPTREQSLSELMGELSNGHFQSASKTCSFKVKYSERPAELNL